MISEDEKLLMSKVIKNLEQYKTLTSYSDKLVKAAEDLLKYEDAEVHASIKLKIDTKHELKTADLNLSDDDMDPDKFLDLLRSKAGKTDKIETIKHNIELKDLSHMLTLGMIQYLNDKIKDKKYNISKENNKIGNSIKWDEEDNSK